MRLFGLYVIMKLAAFVDSPKVREGGRIIRQTLALHRCINWLSMMDLTMEIVIRFEASSMVWCMMNRHMFQNVIQL